MPPRTQNKSTPAHQVACRCRAHGCHLGKYIDAHGCVQSGVEVLPSTRDAHELVDRRNLIREAHNSTTQGLTRSTVPGVRLSRANAAGTDDLDTAFRYMALSSTSSPGQQSNDQERSTCTSTPVIPKISSNIVSKKCRAGQSAKQLGISVYNCGAYLFVFLNNKMILCCRV